MKNCRLALIGMRVWRALLPHLGLPSPKSNFHSSQLAQLEPGRQHQSEEQRPGKQLLVVEEPDQRFLSRLELSRIMQDLEYRNTLPQESFAVVVGQCPP